MIMTKVLLYGVIPENNFGGPSLMHGARELIRELNNNYEIVFYQATKPVNHAISDMGFEVFQIPYKKTYNLLLEAVKFKFGLKIKDKECLRFFNHIKTSDIAANLLGICFSSKFDKGKYGYIKSIKSVIGTFAVSFVAKMYRVKTVKCPASYGPIESKNDIKQARLAARYIFDLMFAREKESKRQMKNGAGIKKNILFSPDLANLMPCPKPDLTEKKNIGISVSHQIIRQWKSKEAYINCMVKLIKHLISKTGKKIILIPNEITIGNVYNDIHVAKDLLGLLNYIEEVALLDITNMNSTQLKTEIAKCEVIISSRYHSCVAALSAGVPTLVIGWHYKYNELLQLYGQDKWIISCDNCTSDKLITLFDEFWESRGRERKVIKEKYKEVREAILDAGKIMLAK